jgi:multidrug efflux pump subunit AcrA (membrane-fusion protein)
MSPGMVAHVTLRDSKLSYTAHLTLIAGAADPTTRLSPITGQFDKTDTVHHRLVPGAFCQVSIPIDAPREAIIVPSLAIAPTETGSLVYIVDAKTSTVHARVVELGMHTADGGIELTRGVTAGEVMVARGIEPLSEGAPVKVGASLTEQQALQPPPDAGVAALPISPAEAPGSGGSAK